MGAARARVILVGDSIRQAFEPRVRERLAAVADVEGPAENGGDTRNLLAHLEDWVIDRDPDLVYLNAGLHDIKRPRGGGEPAVPLDEYARNLREIFGRLRRGTRARVIWASSTPVDDARHAARKSFDRHERDVVAWNAAAARVAAEFFVPVHDLHALIRDGGGAALLWHDGIHLTDEGYRVLGDAVADFILARLASKEQRA